jgi:hypothetical protein
MFALLFPHPASPIKGEETEWEVEQRNRVAGTCMMFGKRGDDGRRPLTSILSPKGRGRKKVPLRKGGRKK